ncbi:hypothetical protein OS493_000568, partial [Desmophyllum pertusum]
MQIEIDRLRRENSGLITTVEVLSKLVGKQANITNETTKQILTKEHVAQPDTPGSNHGQADINFAEAAKRPRLNLHQTGQKTPVITTQNRFESLQGETPLRQDPPPPHKSTESSNSASNKSSTVLIVDSMVKQIHGWKLGKK